MFLPRETADLSSLDIAAGGAPSLLAFPSPPLPPPSPSPPSPPAATVSVLNIERLSRDALQTPFMQQARRRSTEFRLQPLKPRVIPETAAAVSSSNGEDIDPAASPPKPPTFMDPGLIRPYAPPKDLKCKPHRRRRSTNDMTQGAKSVEDFLLLASKSQATRRGPSPDSAATILHRHSVPDITLRPPPPNDSPIYPPGFSPSPSSGSSSSSSTFASPAASSITSLSTNPSTSSSSGNISPLVLAPLGPALPPARLELALRALAARGSPCRTSAQTLAIRYAHVHQTIPSLVLLRSPPHLNPEELAAILCLELDPSMSTARPGEAEAATAQALPLVRTACSRLNALDIKLASQTAFAHLSNVLLPAVAFDARASRHLIELALSVLLSGLKGAISVRQGTLILSLVCPEVPFFSDEASRRISGPSLVSAWSTESSASSSMQGVEFEGGRGGGAAGGGAANTSSAASSIGRDTKTYISFLKRIGRPAGGARRWERKMWVEECLKTRRSETW